jgi:hypothetical protein
MADSFCRWEVEARLLAGEGFDQVAEKCGLRASAVEAYHALFFDVRGSLRLRSTDYIATVVIGPRRLSGLTAADVDILLKLFGYGGGPLVLDGVIRYFRCPLPIPDRWNGLDADALAELRSQLLLKASILALTTPANPKNLKKLEALHDALQDLAGHGAGEVSSAGLHQPLRTEVDLAQALAASQLESTTAMAIAEVNAGADGQAKVAA